MGSIEGDTEGGTEGGTEAGTEGGTEGSTDGGTYGSTERTSKAASIETLEARDLPGALALSRSASWNQREADWRMMLEVGRGWCIRAPGDETRIAASTVVLPYDPSFAWVSMVLVLPEFRGQGYASRLLRHALDELARTGSGGVLDATPAGRPVYVQEGFVDSSTFRRYRRESAPAAAPSAKNIDLRPLDARDWPAIATLDRPVFGGDRTALLHRLASRLPRAAHVAGRDGRLCGFVLGRDGREATQIGPLVADDVALAEALLDAALRSIDGPVYVDAVDDRPEWLAAVAARGFVEQRPFTRMLYALERAPGNASRVFLVAGPELG
ncbi:MAG: GNAT family N-acetyltransferase [Burkholderiaceae bacterium]|nr:GNAT family N-acetyltransferase [Burkholderiaceae bacterium]